MIDESEYYFSRNHSYKLYILISVEVCLFYPPVIGPLRSLSITPRLSPTAKEALLELDPSGALISFDFEYPLSKSKMSVPKGYDTSSTVLLCVDFHYSWVLQRWLNNVISFNPRNLTGENPASLYEFQTLHPRGCGLSVLRSWRFKFWNSKPLLELQSCAGISDRAYGLNRAN